MGQGSVMCLCPSSYIPPPRICKTFAVPHSQCLRTDAPLHLPNFLHSWDCSAWRGHGTLGSTGGTKSRIVPEQGQSHSLGLLAEPKGPLYGAEATQHARAESGHTLSSAVGFSKRLAWLLLQQKLSLHFLITW